MTFVHTLRAMKFQKKIFNLKYKPTVYKKAKVSCSITSVVKQKKKNVQATNTEMRQSKRKLIGKD